MEEQARALRRDGEQGQVAVAARRQLRLDALRQKLDPLIREFVATAVRVGLRPTPDIRHLVTHRDDYQRGEWVIVGTYWPKREDFEHRLIVDIWADGSWVWRYEPVERELRYLLDEDYVSGLRESFVKELSAGM